MPVDGKIKWEASINHQKMINDYNKILAVHDKEIAKLKQKVAISKKADRAGRKASKSMGGVMSRSLPQILSAAVAMRTVVGLFRQIEQMTFRPFQGVQELLDTSKKLIQLQAGQSDLRMTARQQELAEEVAVKQAIFKPEAQEFVFAAISRELTEKQIRKLPKLDFLPNLAEAFKFAADAVAQFEDLDLNERGIERALAIGVAAARASKVETGVILSLFGRPSQFAESLGISVEELATVISVGVAGTTDPKEAATQSRAFFSQIGTKPKLRRVAKAFREGDLLAGLDYIQAMSPKRQDLLFGSEVRAGAAARFYQKGSSQALIRATLPRVMEASRFAGLGGDKDVLQELSRAMEANTKIQQTLIPRRAQIEEQNVLQSTAAGLVGRRAVIETRNAIVNAALTEAQGAGMGGRISRTVMSALEYPFRPFMTEAEIMAGGVARVERQRPRLGDERTDQLIALMEDSFLRLMDGAKIQSGLIEDLISVILHTYSDPVSVARETLKNVRFVP